MKLLLLSSLLLWLLLSDWAPHVLITKSNLPLRQLKRSKCRQIVSKRGREGETETYKDGVRRKRRSRVERRVGESAKIVCGDLFVIFHLCLIVQGVLHCCCRLNGGSSLSLSHSLICRLTELSVQVRVCLYVCVCD